MNAQPRVKSEWRCQCGQWVSDQYLWHDHAIFDTAFGKPFQVIVNYRRYDRKHDDPKRLVPYEAPPSDIAEDKP